MVPMTEGLGTESTETRGADNVSFDREPVLSGRGALRQTVYEAFILVVMLVVALGIMFPRVVLYGEMISPSSLLYDIAPWSAYVPAGWKGSPDHGLMDMLVQGRPWYYLVHQAIARGEWPLWNELWPLGMPLLANGQSAVFYPPHMLHALLDTDVATTLYVVLKLAICGVTAYLCGRGLGFKPATGRFLAVAWMLGSYNQVYCSWPLTDASAWFPLIFLGTEYLVEGRWRRGATILTIAASLSLLAGHPETTFVGGLGTGVYFLLRLAHGRKWREMRLALGAFAASWCIALLVAAVQIIPLLEFISNGVSFFLAVQENAPRPLTPSMTAVFWIQRFFGTLQENNFWGDFHSVVVNALYPGLPVMAALSLLLAPFKNATPTDHSRTRSVCLVITAVFVLLLAFNVSGVRNLNNLPVFRNVLLHHYVVFPLFAVALLSSQGLNRWFGSPRRFRELAWCILPGIVGVIVVACVCYARRKQIHLDHYGAYIFRQILIAAGIFLASVLCLALHTMRVRVTVAAGVLTLLLAADLLYANRGFAPTIAKERIVPDIALTRYLQALPRPYRIDSEDTNMLQGFMACYDLEFLGAIDALMPRRLVDLASLEGTCETSIPLSLTSIVLRDPKVAPEKSERYQTLEHLKTLDGIEVYRDSRAIPRVFLAGTAERVSGLEDFTQRLCQMGSESILATVLVECPPETVLPRNSDTNVGNAHILSYRSTRVTVETNARVPSVLVLSDTCYPGWKARVDSLPVEIFPAYHAFRAVLIPAGTHQVVFEYRPLSFRLGMAISIVTLCVLLVWGARQVKRHAPSRRASSKEIPPSSYNDALFLTQHCEGFTEFTQGELSPTKTKEVSLLDVRPGDRLLEVGFGRGEVLRACAVAGAEVVGIDFSPSAHAIARQTLASFPEAALMFADCRMLPFASSSFDRVFAADVIEHLCREDGITLLREMYRVLKPGGLLLVHTAPNAIFRTYLYPVLRPFIKIIDPGVVDGIDAQVRLANRIHVFEYSLISLRRAAREAQLGNADIWLDQDLLRASTHRFTQPLSSNRFVRLLANQGNKAWVRFFLSNDLYLRASK